MVALEYDGLLATFVDHAALSFGDSEPCQGHILTVTL